MKYEVTVDGISAQLSIDGASFRYGRDDGEPIDRAYAWAECGNGVYSVLIDGRSHTVTRLGEDEFSVNGRAFHIAVLDPRSLRGRKAAASAEGRQAIAALMPGRVIRVLVQIGETVEAGQGLIVVEAMKMQNEMKSPKAGHVIEVKSMDGATVAAGDILLVIE